jgi:hypothetical protein
MVNKSSSMRINPEIIEWSAIVAPAILASLLLVLRAGKIQIWCVKVIGSSAVSLVSIGLTLMRLTAQCAADGPKCDTSHTVTNRVPGIIRICQMCVDSSNASFWARANEVELQAQAIVAALCLGASLVVTVHFIVWCKKHVFSS